MFCSKAESDFLLSHIDKSKKVLEYGSGESTIEIARLCKSILSIESNKRWYKKIKPKLPKNAVIILSPPNKECIPPDDGNYEQFKTYINSPLKFAPFDIIFIDGRARVECAKLCKSLGHKDSIVFIHDFERKIYQPALDYLNLIGQVERMAKFTVK